jgi:hypothetical protein
MKLKTLQEAKYASKWSQYPTVAKLMVIGTDLKSDFQFNDLAWITACMDMQHAGECDLGNLAYHVYDPGPGLKDNPERVEGYLSDVIDDVVADAEYDKIPGEEAVREWLTDNMDFLRHR